MLKSLLIANRGEIAIRIARAAAELGIRTLAIHSEDDAHSLHVSRADKAAPLKGVGARAYLDISQIVALARAEGCDAVHPGYGFLSENADFARACLDAGLTFVGPAPRTLDQFGDKSEARRLAQRCAVRTPRGTQSPTTLKGAQAFLAGLGAGGAVMVKATAGGGGRGLRLAASGGELADIFERCASEAKAAFGAGDLYVEEFIANARHIEAQVIGDHAGRVIALGERECSLQRRHQKLVEIAPAPSLPAVVRAALADAALVMAREAGVIGLTTFEFLVPLAAPENFLFIEANPRLQVEHTVTEEVTGVDLVKAQLRIAGGESLADIGLDDPEALRPRGYSIELRINMETIDADGAPRPASGAVTVYEPATGPGVRVDGCGYSGYRPSPHFDSLLAKLIVHSPSPRYEDALFRARRALGEFRIEGIGVNLGFLSALLDHPDVASHQVSTRFLDEHAREFAEAARAGAPADAESDANAEATGPDGALAIRTSMIGLVISIDVAESDCVRRGQQLAVLEAMKMEHVTTAAFAGIVRRISARTGEVLTIHQPLMFIEPSATSDTELAAAATADLEAIRPDLAEALARRELRLDSARARAVEKRHAQGGRTARENIDDLVDPGTFVEYGGLTFAAQRSRRPLDELMRATPADGLIAGLGTVNAGLFGEERSACAVAAYDYTVLAGTQGGMNHKKQDRFYRLVHELRRPLILFAEGGGGRPGDTDHALISVSGGDLPTWMLFGGLSGLAPLIGIVHGRCFAGNAALVGCCDVIIATESATIGMAGPAMIEGGGLGVFEPEDVGPVSMQAPNGVIDLVARDEAEAVALAKQYLGYFQGPLADWKAADQRLLRSAIPENRLRVYDIRSLVRTLADEESVLELRPSFGVGIVTALVRIEGRAFGLIANNPMHLGGAIDADAADKAARFLQLCDAHDLPIVSLTDTPGFMVGPDAERKGLVRRACRMFVNGATTTVPYFTIVLRKGYGLGAMAMARGSYHGSIFTASWPTGEFGGMGLEGAVRLAYRKELAAIADPDEREAEFRRRVASSYEHGKAINTAAVLEIDDVIDPMDTRRWLMRGLKSVAPRPPRTGKKRPHIEPW